MPSPYRTLLHQTPTHADNEDRFLFGLTGRQFLVAVLSLILAYGLWDWMGAGWPMPLRTVPAVLIALVGLAAAFLKPGGRSLWEYLFVRLRAAVVPRVTVWRPARHEW
jgi:PrgI family protein